MYPLALEGWDEKSVWGWDDQTETWFAELTQNGKDDSDGPEVWLSGVPRPIPDEAALAAMIARAAGRPAEDVQAAMRDGRR